MLTLHSFRRVHSNHRSKAKGFTLIEVMIVIAILILLTTIAVPQLFRAFEDARRQRLEIDAHQALLAVDRAILQERLRGSVGNINGMELTVDVLSSAYGLRLTGTDGAVFRYYHTAADSSSSVEVSYENRVYSTNTGVWRDE